MSSRWQLALDAAQRALSAASESLPAPELRRRRVRLALELRQTEKMLVGLARATGIGPNPWLSPVPIGREMLGLPSTTAACLFDLDGVLTNSAQLHALAWGTVFDEYLLRLSEKTGWLFIPFDRDADYRDYVEGRSRLEGVHAFLASRGIALSEEAAHTLASRKGVVLAASLRGRGASALAGARRYLEAAGRAGIERAVISASTSTVPMLEQAGLATLVEEHVDAEVIRLRHLRSRPAADCLLFACLRLGVPPGDVVTFTQSPAGVAAGLSAGLTVIGVGDGRDAELLRGGGAHQVVPSLRALLDSRLLGERR